MPTSQVVLIQEILKLIVAFSIIFFNKNFRKIHQEKNIAISYLIPATLYAAYNNLSIVALSLFTPSTYFLLLQFRIVVVGLLSVFVLRRKISIKQWIALGIVMIGTMVKEGFDFRGPDDLKSYSVIAVQLLLSASAGILNEYLLRGNSVSGDIQNFYMYFDAIFVNILFLTFFPGGSRTISADVSVWGPVAFNGAITGIITGYFLVHLDSIWKAIASAIEIWITAMLGYWVFGYEIGVKEIVGFVTVSVGAFLYASSGSVVTKKRT